MSNKFWEDVRLKHFLFDAVLQLKKLMFWFCRISLEENIKEADKDEEDCVESNFRETWRENAQV